MTAHLMCHDIAARYRFAVDWRGWQRSIGYASRSPALPSYDERACHRDIMLEYYMWTRRRAKAPMRSRKAQEGRYNCEEVENRWRIMMWAIRIWKGVASWRIPAEGPTLSFRYQSSPSVKRNGEEIMMVVEIPEVAISTKQFGSIWTRISFYI